ncbi:MFS transporter [Streptomyces sp. TLI_053]|uniref:MFS transporter n=1 Tax=Streptomyces sp. TLI_053 TaxID=1855352 RepID=UPI000B823B5C|nr:MFS transporter [Streptomyces sp. TLI_053]
MVASQLVSGAGLTAGIVVGALLAEQMLGSTGLAGIPTALFTGGSMLGALVVGRLCQRRGRRPGLGTGYAIGALGSVGVVAAVALDQVALLLPSLLVYGAGTATNLLARYAGADLAAPHRRARALSRVLLAATLGAVAGPNLVPLTGDLARAWGIPPLAGPFLLAALGYTAAAVLLTALLRPDPLHLAQARLPAPEAPAADGDASDGSDSGDGAHPVRKLRKEADRRRGPGFATGLWIMLLGQLPKVALMTMTPVHLAANGHGTGTIGLVVSLHIAAMFLPSPLTGLLTDRLGALPVAAASGVLLCAAALLAAAAPGDSVPLLALALTLAGIAWNLGLVSGTAVITAALPPGRGASTQGLADVGLAVAGSTGGLLSGLVVTAGGYDALALGCALTALLVTPLALRQRLTALEQERTGAPAG